MTTTKLKNYKSKIQMFTACAQEEEEGKKNQHIARITIKSTVVIRPYVPLILNEKDNNENRHRYKHNLGFHQEFFRRKIPLINL